MKTIWYVAEARIIASYKNKAQAEKSIIGRSKKKPKSNFFLVEHNCEPTSENRGSG